jgi:hypothetical protein
MFDSSFQMRYENISKPIDPHKVRRNPHNLAFMNTPSRIVPYREPDRSFADSTHLAALLLSLPLAQKIHRLLLTSRQIEWLARGLFSGGLSEREVAAQMSSLEFQYDNLREQVECELENAWVDAGFLPAKVSTFQAPSKTAKSKAPNPHDWHKPSYTVEKDLKRKHQEEEESGRNKPSSKKGKKKRKVIKRTESDVSECGMVPPTPLQPIGISHDMVPLGEEESSLMDSWSFSAALERGGAMDQCLVSPMGTVFAI